MRFAKGTETAGKKDVNGSGEDEYRKKEQRSQTEMNSNIITLLEDLIKSMISLREWRRGSVQEKDGERKIFGYLSAVLET